MKHKFSALCIYLGLLLLVGAVGLSGWFLYENRQADKASQTIEQQIRQIVTPVLPPAADTPSSRREIPDYQLDPTREMPTVSVNDYDCIGTLVIPALDRSLPVISDWNYDNLRIAPCRYEGSAYDGSLIIAAHNYTAHFGSLSTLQIGDRLTFTDMDGNVFSYDVIDMTTISPDAVEQLYEGDWDLTLFTCTFGNTYRVVVRCRLLPNPSTPVS